MPRISSLGLVAEWLAQQVGEGSVFTKQDLRVALPQFEQADRRMRDLRDYGWTILTNREDASLRPNELRLVKIGLPVWDPGVARVARNSEERVSPAERSRELLSAGYLCRRCGIGAGEIYPEAKTTQVFLSVRRREHGFEVLCQFCLRGGSDSLAALKALIESLNPVERAELKTWLAGERPFERVEIAWSLARRGPVGEVLDLL
jgi:hypothetical protein